MSIDLSGVEELLSGVEQDVLDQGEVLSGIYARMESMDRTLALSVSGNDAFYEAYQEQAESASQTLWEKPLSGYTVMEGLTALSVILLLIVVVHKFLEVMRWRM